MARKTLLTLLAAALFSLQGDPVRSPLTLYGAQSDYGFAQTKRVFVGNESVVDPQVEPQIGVQENSSPGPAPLPRETLDCILGYTRDIPSFDIPDSENTITVSFDNLDLHFSSIPVNREPVYVGLTPTGSIVYVDKPVGQSLPEDGIHEIDDWNVFLMTESSQRQLIPKNIWVRDRELRSVNFIDPKGYVIEREPSAATNYERIRATYTHVLHADWNSVHVRVESQILHRDGFGGTWAEDIYSDSLANAPLFKFDLRKAIDPQEITITKEESSLIVHGLADDKRAQLYSLADWYVLVVEDIVAEEYWDNLPRIFVGKAGDKMYEALNSKGIEDLDFHLMGKFIQFDTNSGKFLGLIPRAEEMSFSRNETSIEGTEVDLTDLLDPYVSRVASFTTKGGVTDVAFEDGAFSVSSPEDRIPTFASIYESALVYVDRPASVVRPFEDNMSPEGWRVHVQTEDGVQSIPVIEIEQDGPSVFYEPKGAVSRVTFELDESLARSFGYPAATKAQLEYGSITLFEGDEKEYIDAIACKELDRVIPVDISTRTDGDTIVVQGWYQLDGYKPHMMAKDENGTIYILATENLQPSQGLSLPHRFFFGKPGEVLKEAEHLSFDTYGGGIDSIHFTYRGRKTSLEMGFLDRVPEGISNEVAGGIFAWRTFRPATGKKLESLKFEFEEYH